jgi:hypothetical protein
MVGASEEEPDVDEEPKPDPLTIWAILAGQQETDTEAAEPEADAEADTRRGGPSTNAAGRGAGQVDVEPPPDAEISDDTRVSVLHVCDVEDLTIDVIEFAKRASGSFGFGHVGCVLDSSGVMHSGARGEPAVRTHRVEAHQCHGVVAEDDARVTLTVHHEAHGCYLNPIRFLADPRVHDAFVRFRNDAADSDAWRALVDAVEAVANGPGDPGPTALIDNLSDPGGPQPRHPGARIRIRHTTPPRPAGIPTHRAKHAAREGHA